MKQQKFLLLLSGILGFTGVALGAFGAHVLKNQITSEMLEIFKTGVFYQLIHTAVVLSIALSGKDVLYKPALFLISGIILFSFSLYLYALTNFGFFAFITPFGGVSFLAGWALIIISFFREKRKE